MKILKSKIIAALIFTVLVAATISVANAQVSSLWTSNDNNPNHHENEFSPGQTVYIFWSPTGSNQHIRVTDVNDHTMHDFGTISNQPATWQIPSDAAAGTIYWIVIPGVGPYPIAVSTVHVLPENSWGTLVAITAAFAVFGAFSVLRNKPQSKKEKVAK